MATTGNFNSVVVIDDTEAMGRPHVTVLFVSDGSDPSKSFHTSDTPDQIGNVLTDMFGLVLDQHDTDWWNSLGHRGTYYIYEAPENILSEPRVS